MDRDKKGITGINEPPMDMKKIALLFIALMATGVNAQRMHLIPKVGIDHAYMTDVDGRLFKPGFVVGLGTEFMIGPILAIEPGIYYAMQGFHAERPSGEEIKLKNNYINIPLYAKLYLIKGIHLYAGPQVSFRLHTKASVSSGETLVGEYIKNPTNKVDLSGIVGVGYQSAIGFVLSANYNIGALSVFKKQATINGNPIDVRDVINPKNRVIQLNVGWRF